MKKVMAPDSKEETFNAQTNVETKVVVIYLNQFELLLK